MMDAARPSRFLALGFSPYGGRFERSHSAAQIRNHFSSLAAGERATTQVRIAGRLRALRRHGRLAFADMEDASGRVQVCFEQQALPNGWRLIGELRAGDIIGIEGTPFRTQRGELSINAGALTPLAIALRQLPGQHFGLSDPEERQRRRYLDMLVNPDVMARLTARSRIISRIRNSLEARGFIEVETPMLQPLHGGASARPFVTHHNTLDMQLYLRIAPELYLKRMIVGGFERVFEINRNFRNEGISARHNPEFTMLELYEAYGDWTDGMRLCEQLIDEAARCIGCGQTTFNGHNISLQLPFRRLSMRQALQEIAIVDASEEGLRAAAAQHNLDASQPYGLLLAAMFEQLVEPRLIQPTFITEYPVETCPLALRLQNDPRFTQRYEFYVAGMEIANGYSELNDPADQRQRFEEQAREHAAGNLEAHPYDEDFVRALEHGMPPTSGLGIGIDRLAMILTGAGSIREVIAFPLVRERENNG